MGLVHLARDSIDVQYVAQDPARRVQTPTTDGMSQTKTCVRYLQRNFLRTLHIHDFPNRLAARSDANFACCTAAEIQQHCLCS